MFPTDEPEGSAANERDAVQMHREMETRRLAMLKLIDESKAKLKTLLKASKPSDPTKSAAERTD